ncbi:unnamed protein product [Kuraishia capsulata CBS 1993]|uniref:Large ribosomal subunit protein uL30m n=1 Tax=Kuraishia capsulata CBS 1993 TaxID=1382522 RepID=W6MPE7_9ASCO|nr:uncharacterized protein KUCA_T00004542001 [Kuraishia capsulata CBS 1993]CDK28559.1 unnamed protein product [Kuraishia capsulata CBS 1993]
MPPKFFKITQIRSQIARPQVYKDTLAKLGLRKPNQVVYHKVTPQQAGMLARVKELVKVELTDVKETKSQMRDARRTNPGFSVEKK